MLARIGVASAPEEVEPLREALSDLRRRKNGGASSSKLDRERQIVETSTEIRDLVVARKPRAGAKEILGRVLRKRRHLILDLALQPQQLAARHQQAEIAARAQQQGELDGRVDHMLEVVEQ